ncbi:MAG: hypothetical protein ACTHN5_18840 [Phycisphaerae bacterium]
MGTRRMMVGGLRVSAAAILMGIGVRGACGAAVGIQGTMSNFDVFNETGTNAYGAEIDIEGVHSADVTKTYPCHFTGFSATDYTSGSTFGTKIVFTGYNFTANGYITPTVGQTTNGHYCVNLPGCEHFGFAVGVQPGKTSFFWLDQGSQRIGNAPLTMPTSTWTFVPAVGGGAPMVQAVLQPPKPPPVQLYPDAVWVKTYVTEVARQVDLLELISSPPEANGVAPQLPSEVESEWDLLPGDMPLAEPDIVLGEADQAVIRRFEYYKYLGGYDEVHLPTSAFTGGAPDPLELGQFIVANMEAVNLEVVPEPGMGVVVLAGVAGVLMRRRRG